MQCFEDSDQGPRGLTDARAIYLYTADVCSSPQDQVGVGRDGVGWGDVGRI